MWAQDYNKPNDKITFMNTLTSCVNKVVKDGYTDSFKVTRQGLYSPARDQYYRPEEVQVINFYRFEGESDPGDMVIMYVIETSDGAKGTLVDAFGTYSDESVNNFMKEVEDIQKKAVKHDRPE